MDTAIAEPTIDEQALVAQKGNTVLFLSRRSELRVVWEPRYPRIAAGSGRQTGEEPGKCVNFKRNQFVCPREGEVALEDGRKFPAEEVLAFLESHSLNGDVNGGFWPVDPTAPAVTTKEIEALVHAATEGDEETLRAILRQELEGWEREQIITVARGALERTLAVNEVLAREDAVAAREAALAGAPAPAAAEVADEAEAPADVPPVLSELARQMARADDDGVSPAPGE